MMLTTKIPETTQSRDVPRVRKPGPSQPMNSPVDRILFLQRTIGNQAVLRMMQSKATHSKITMGRPDDIYEQEANRVAERVMHGPEPEIQRAPT
ncbi:MAG: hypothetical protein KJ630_21990 [Proteobacteria bacterium]|nr:hypothetical protein [Pseudomonadota bacterium]